MRSWILGLTVAAVTTNARFALAEDVPMKDLPEQVRKTIEQEAKGAKIEDLERERTADGKIYYEVEIERDNQDWKLRIDQAGKVTERLRDY